MADFGLSRKVRADRPVVQTQDAVGTLLYISPEALRGVLVKSSVGAPAWVPDCWLGLGEGGKAGEGTLGRRTSPSASVLEPLGSCSGPPSLTRF